MIYLIFLFGINKNNSKEIERNVESRLICIYILPEKNENIKYKQEKMTESTDQVIKYA